MLQFGEGGVGVDPADIVPKEMRRGNDGWCGRNKTNFRAANFNVLLKQ